MALPLSIAELTLLLISGTLILTAADFVLTHLRDPRSDLVFNSKVAPTSTPNSTRAGEIQMELYFMVQNRGEDIGYVMGAEIDWFEFYNDDPTDSDKQIVHLEEFIEPIYGAMPIVILNQDLGDDYARAPIMVKINEPEKLFVIPRIFAIGHMNEVKEGFEKVRARVKFTVSDSEGSYERTVYSDPLSAERLEPP